MYKLFDCFMLASREPLQKCLTELPYFHSWYSKPCQYRVTDGERSSRLKKQEVALKGKKNT